MKPSLISLDLVVADLLKAWPQAIPVFLDHRLGCVGCAMSSFDTLADVVAIYRLPADRFLGETSAGYPGHRIEPYRSEGDVVNHPYAYFENLVAEMPEIPADSILSRSIYQDEQIKVVLFGFAQGQELSEHTASQTALLYFVQGEADLTLGGEAQRAVPGTIKKRIIIFPSNFKTTSIENAKCPPRQYNYCSN